jgi:hypothetical protein
MDFRAGSDITDLSLYQDGRVDAFQRFDRLPGLTHILLERQRGKVKDDRVEASLHGLHRFGERMRMVGIEKDGKVEFLTEGSYQSRELTSSDKLTLFLGRAHQDRDFQFARGREDRL